jgi:GGDEF domain-containing protein
MNLHPSSSDVEPRLRERFERAQYEGTPVACFLIAIDRLERVADAGLREVIRTAVEGLVAHEPESREWQVSRMGEQLFVLCPGLTLHDAPPVAKRLVDEARKLRIEHGPRKVRVSLSIGVAHNKNRHELVFEAFLGVAVESLGVAQGAGGNRWVHTELYDMLRRRFPDRAPTPPPEALAPAPAEAPTAQPDAATAPAAPAPVPTPPATVAPGAVVELRPGAAPPAAAVPNLPPPREEAETDNETIDILQRRVRKLAHSLEQAEAQIAALRGEHTEPGIASIYRTVQGLAPDEAYLDLKRKLMFDIYEANRQLQQVANN